MLEHPAGGPWNICNLDLQNVSFQNCQKSTRLQQYFYACNLSGDNIRLIKYTVIGLGIGQADRLQQLYNITNTDHTFKAHKYPGGYFT